MRLALLLPVGVAVLGGCSANVSASADVADAEASPAAAVIVVERTAGETTRGEAVARFVRGRSAPLDERALRWLGLEPDLPAVGSCVKVATDVPSMPATGVRLLDVGRVTIAADGALDREPQTMELVRRRLPDVVDVVSGVVYTASTVDLPARGSFDVRVMGEPELGAVRVTSDFAGEPAQIRIQGQDAAGPVVVNADAPIDIAWDASKTDDLVYIDFVGADALGRKTVTRCTASDGGRAVFSIASAVLGDGESAVVVHRMHRTGFRAAGIDRGELRLDFAREVPVTVRARR
ncbi:MAG: hypothetical protein U0235_03575 [Polyangiaceae bacterium]